MFCENCGNKLPGGAKFCDVCGAKTKSTPQVNSDPIPVKPPPRLTQSSPAYSTQQSYTPPPVSAKPVSGITQSNPAYSTQQSYAQQQPVSYTTPNYTNAAPLSVGQYIVMYLLLCVPLLGLVLLFVWGFGGSVNPNKRNFARASLIFAAIGLVLTIIGGGVFMAVLSEIMSGFY